MTEPALKRWSEFENRKVPNGTTLRLTDGRTFVKHTAGMIGKTGLMLAGDFEQEYTLEPPVTAADLLEQLTLAVRMLHCAKPYLEGWKPEHDMEVATMERVIANYRSES